MKAEKKSLLRLLLAVCLSTALVASGLCVVGYHLIRPVLLAGYQQQIQKSTSTEKQELTIQPMKELILALAAGVLLVTATAGIAARVATERNRRTLTAIRDSVERLAVGHIVPLQEDARSDLAGETARAVNVSYRQLKERREELAAILSKMARGDFRYTLCANYEGGYTALRSSIEDISTAMYQALSQIGDTTRLVHGDSRLMADSSAGLAQGVAAQSRSVTVLTRSLKALSGQLAKNVWRAGNARRYMSECGNSAQINERQMRLLLTAVEEMLQLSTELADTHDKMEELSSQAAILAVSASIEASRAKDMGFAVVADEMKDLSNQLAKIEHQLETLSDRGARAVDRGKRMAVRAADGLHSVADKSERAAAAALEIEQAADAQNQAAERALHDVEMVAGAVQTSSVIAAQNNLSSKELAARSQLLSQLVSGFYAQGAVPPKSK